MNKKAQFNPKKLLLIRTDRIGDVVLTLPMVDTLAANFPDAKIDFLVKKRVQELISDYSNINKVHAIEKETVSGIRRICSDNGYDLAIIVSPRFQTALGVFLGGIRYRLGTAKRWYSFLFNIRHSQHRKFSTMHEMEYNLDLLDELNCFKIKGIRPVLKVKTDYLESLRGKANFLDSRSGFIVMHISSLGSSKVWSNQNFAKLLDLITGDKTLNINVILTGTQDDVPQIEGVLTNVKDKSRIFQITDLNLNELAGLLSFSRMFVSNSTGPIHIAAAVGTFVVGIYSPVRAESPVRWEPVTDKKKIFVPEKDDNTRNIMDDIKPKEVYEFVRDYLYKDIKN